MAGIRAQRRIERPAAILQAALEEFIQKGYAATRLEDVARRAGVTKGTIYFYFGSKEEVFAQTIRTIAAQPLAAFGASAPPWTGDIVEDVRSFLERLYHFIADTSHARETLRLMIAEAHRFPDLTEAYVRQFMDPVVEGLRLRLVDAKAQGQLRLDIPYLTDIVLSPPLANHVIVLLLGDRRPFDVDEILRSHMILLTEGLLPRIEPKSQSRVEGETDRGWTSWRSFPKSVLRESLTAPIGPGLFEIRLASHEPLLLTSARSVAGEIAMLFGTDDRLGNPNLRSKRGFLMQHIDTLEYRTLGCETYDEAKILVRHTDRRTYRFRR